MSNERVSNALMHATVSRFEAEKTGSYSDNRVIFGRPSRHWGSS